MASMKEDIGYIKARIEDIVRQLDGINKCLNLTNEKVAKHDIIFGKIGVVITAAVFFISLTINFAFDYLKSKFFRG